MGCDFFNGFLGVYEQRHKKQTHGPELADADDGLCFLFFGFLGVYEQRHQKPKKKTIPRPMALN